MVDKVMAIDSDLVMRCRELLEWSKTGFLNCGSGGRVMSAANRLQQQGISERTALTVVERMTHDEAMEEVVRLSVVFSNLQSISGEISLPADGSPPDWCCKGAAPAAVCRCALEEGELSKLRIENTKLQEQCAGRANWMRQQTEVMRKARDYIDYCLTAHGNDIPGHGLAAMNALDTALSGKLLPEFRSQPEIDK